MGFQGKNVVSKFDQSSVDETLVKYAIITGAIIGDGDCNSVPF